MRKKLTDRLLRSIKPPESGRIVITDTEHAGLRFRMTANGKASFLLEKKIKGGKRRAFTLGSYPLMSLAEARSAALDIEKEAKAGIDRIDVAATKEIEDSKAKTVGDILELYISTHIDRDLKPGNSRDERKRQLRGSLEPLLSTKMENLSRSDLQRIVDSKAAEGKVPMANRLRSALCAFTRWSYLRGHVTSDVGAGVQKAGRETPRRRSPTLSEVREIWAASFECGNLWGPFFRLCILTGQRSREEVLKMQWSWVDFEKCRMEIPTTKSGRPHVVHLQDAAVAELQTIRQQQQDSKFDTPFVFTTTGRTAASGVSRAKKTLERVISENRQKTGIEEPMEPWVLHDLRRSQATTLAEAGYSEGVVDRIQNHVAVGSRPSVVSAVYTLAEMLPERARALDHWEQLVTSESSDVVDLRPTSRR